MQTMLLKAMMALATLLSSHRDAIATLDFFYKNRNDNQAIARDTRHDLYRISQRIQNYIQGPHTDDGYIRLSIEQVQALRDGCNDARANLITLTNETKLPVQAPYPGMLHHSHPSLDGNPTHHQDIHSAACATWRSIKCELDDV